MIRNIQAEESISVDLFAHLMASYYPEHIQRVIEHEDEEVTAA